MALDDADLAQLLEELCDHAQDLERTMDPLPDETLAPLRRLAEWMRPLEPQFSRLVREQLAERHRNAAERSRRVREDLDLTSPDWTSFAAGVNPPAMAFIRPDTEDDADERERRRLEAETTAAMARAEDIMPSHLSRFALSVHAVIGTLGRVMGLAEARRWVAADLRDGALTSESAAERLKLLDELAVRVEGK